MQILQRLGLYSLYILQRIKPYIHQKASWPSFRWDSQRIISPLSEVRYQQGKLLGKMHSLGFDLQNEALLDTLSLDAIQSSDIEGEKLPTDQVRSSIARRLGLEINDSVNSERHVDGMVEMLIDATKNAFERVTSERLYRWHSALFPTEMSGPIKIRVGGWRKDTTGPMQVVSGALGKERVHFEAPASELIPNEMKRFLEWLNDDRAQDLVLKSAIAHIWFLTIHPFEDGNGRMARAISDLLLARADQSAQRFYSMSAQIRLERKEYYEMLEKTQQGNLDLTEWIIWFLNCLKNALQASDDLLESVLFKAAFWNRHAKTAMNDRQKRLLNKLLDGFEGKLTSSKWAKIAKCSKDTAVRDINDLLQKRILQKENAGGRSTSYILFKT